MVGLLLVASVFIYLLGGLGMCISLIRGLQMAEMNVPESDLPTFKTVLALIFLFWPILAFYMSYTFLSDISIEIEVLKNGS